jgi:2-(1,2-epoxy-1,2-dihydrophenyl)acetyl-CoA isomerase
VADLEIQVVNRVMVARLNRPEKKNAQSEEMLELLSKALRSANEDPDIGCFVITGAGDAFCSGGDLGRRSQDEVQADPTPLERKMRLQKISHQVAKAVEEFEKPLIAAVNGAAVGAGMDMALMCDIRVFPKATSVSACCQATGAAISYHAWWACHGRWSCYGPVILSMHPKPCRWG